MQHFLAVVFGWMLVAVAVVAFMSGAPAAAKIAGNSLGTVGITIGAIVGGTDDLFDGYNAAKKASNKQGTAFDTKQSSTRKRVGGGRNGTARAR